MRIFISFLFFVLSSLEISSLSCVEQFEFRKSRKTQTKIQQHQWRLSELSKTLHQISTAKDQCLQIHQYGIQLAFEIDPKNYII